MRREASTTKQPRAAGRFYVRMLRILLVLLLAPNIAFAGQLHLAVQSLTPIFPLLPAACGESMLAQAARPLASLGTPHARTGQGEAQAAQADPSDVHVNSTPPSAAEQPGGWGLPLNETRELEYNEDDQVKRVIRNTQELNRTLYDAQGQKAVHLHRVSGNEETAYMGPNLTIRDGKYITKHVFAGSERVSSTMDPAWFQDPPTLYFHSDHLGSAHYVTNDSEQLIQHAEYLPSGELFEHDTDSRYELARRFLFTGKELDIHTGLYDFGARTYDPRQGQWLSADPAYDGLNLYTYVHNNPVNLIDPLGLSAETKSWDAFDTSSARAGDINGEAAALGMTISGPGVGVAESIGPDASLSGAAACSGSCSDPVAAQTRDGLGSSQQRYENHVMGLRDGIDNIGRDTMLAALPVGRGLKLAGALAGRAGGKLLAAAQGTIAKIAARVAAKRLAMLRQRSTSSVQALLTRCRACAMQG